MKKIGLVDYYISEWHANNYPVWISELCEKEGYDYKITYAYAERDISPVTGESTDEWCARMGVTKCDSIDEVCEKSDYIIILAPSNPEKHLGYAKAVLKYGKRTYIDKTFAPDYPTAKKIFELSEKYGAPFFSTSALRYATELDGLRGADNLLITGGGSNLPEYAVHQIEMAVTLLDSAPLALKLEKQGCQYVARVKFDGAKQVTMTYSPSLPFTVCATVGEREEYREITSDFFKVLMVDIINFFETGKTSFDTKQTLDVMKIRGGIITAEDTLGEWITI